MVHVNYKITYGEIKVRQASDNRLVTVKIHWANALCAFVYHYKNEDGVKMVQLISFFHDEQHIKNCMKHFPSHDCLDFFMGKVVSVKLNLFYKESNILLKYFVRS
jgi:hypothetical protein